MKSKDFISLCLLAFDKEAIKKLVFSRCDDKNSAVKVSGKICSVRDGSVLRLEYSLPSGTVSQRNLKRNEISPVIEEFLLSYRQANLITAVGDAEWKRSKQDKEIILGMDALKRRLSDQRTAFESAIEELDKRKNYILSGKENFLITLGISDKTGRVHDKKQPKFRQINRFLEHIENIYDYLPKEDKLTIYDLCCGKSYLSFAVYHYLTTVKKREVYMLGIDLKKDVIEWCASVAHELSFSGMEFVCDDVNNTPKDKTPDMVISLHACDIATDIVLDRAHELSARIILSTPCCHRYLNDKVKSSELSFVTSYPHIRNKLCEALTDSIRLARLRSYGYSVQALELTDPENTPKNTLIVAIMKKTPTEKELKEAKEEYDKILSFVLGDGKDSYLKEIKG